METAFDMYRKIKRRPAVKNCFLDLDKRIYCPNCKTVLPPEELCAATNHYHPGRYDCRHCNTWIYITRRNAKIANDEITVQENEKHPLG